MASPPPFFKLDVCLTRPFSPVDQNSSSSIRGSCGGGIVSLLSSMMKQGERTKVFLYSFHTPVSSCGVEIRISFATPQSRKRLKPTILSLIGQTGIRFRKSTRNDDTGGANSGLDTDRRICCHGEACHLFISIHCKCTCAWIATNPTSCGSPPRFILRTVLGPW
jgi:hypothetical protein